MSDTPLVSVLMPVYNAERYLSEAVRSVLNQSFADFEFLIINDGSTDASEDVLSRFASEDSRVKVISRPNTGLVVALNEMLGHARGEYVARIDSDDVAFSSRFERQLDFLDRSPEVDVVGSWVECIDPDGRSLCIMKPPLDHDSIDSAHIASRGPLIWHPAAMIRTSAIRDVGGYRPAMHYAEDFDLWLRLAERGQLANVGEVLLKYRQHPHSAAATHRKAAAMAGNAAIVDAYNRRGLRPADAPKFPVATENGSLEIEKWAWWAISSGNISTARRYALESLLRQPFRKAAWKLFACSVRGR